MPIPSEIAPNEELGRSVFSSRDAKRADRNEIPLSVFLEREGISHLSSDRLTIAPQHEAIRIAEKRAEERGPNRSFYGWAIITVGQATTNKRRVVASPQDDNLYHADIILPSELPSEEEQTQHALELAKHARWCRY